MCGTNVLDKDGISACVVLAELACYLAQNGVTLTQQLENIFNKYVKFNSHIYYNRENTCAFILCQIQIDYIENCIHIDIC